MPDRPYVARFLGTISREKFGLGDCRMALFESGEVFMFQSQPPQPQLNDSETLRLIIYNLAEGVVVANRQGKFVLFNDKAREILGTGALDSPLEEWSEAYGCYLPDKTTPFPASELPLARALRGEHAPECEIFIRNRHRPEGAWIRVKGSPIRDAAGELQGGAIVFRDVTRRKEDDLRLQTLTSAVEQTADGILITNRDGVVEYVNPAFEQTTGYSREEIVGRTPRLLKSGSHDPAFYRQMWATITSGQPFRGTLINRKKNGQLFHAEQTITPMRESDGSIAHFVSVLKDVTELRKMQEQEFHMRLARAVQQRFYSVSPPQISGFDIAGGALPVDATGGDYFDFIPLARGTLGVSIGDVSGHGFSAALLMAELRGSLRAMACKTSNIGEILTRTNNVLVDDLEKDRFVTLTLCRLHPTQKTLVYSSAGHVPGYILHSNGTVKRVLESTGLPLGLFSGHKYSTSEAIHIDAGEMLVLLTDGITENEDSSEVQFGVSRALEYVQAQRRESACAIVSGLCQAVKEFSQGSARVDDVTAVVCKSTDPARAGR